MNKQQAVNVIAQALANYRATLQEHQVLQEALKTLSVEEQPKPEIQEKR